MDCMSILYVSCVLEGRVETTTTRFVPTSGCGANSTPWTAVDWQLRCIFIIWLNCAWCAIRMEISPASDDKYFMSVIWAEQVWCVDDELALFYFFYFCLTPGWLSLSDEADWQPPQWFCPAECCGGGRKGGFERDSCCFCPNGTCCLTLLPEIHHPPSISCLIMLSIYLCVFLCVAVPLLPPPTPPSSFSSFFSLE